MSRVLLALLALAGCTSSTETTAPGGATAEAPPAPTTLPAPPFTIVPTPPKGWDQWDPSRVPERMLEETAARYAAEGKWGWASLVQYQFVQAANRTSGRYNLACYLTRAGELDQAIYWLQQAVVEEGVDATWAQQDPDLIALHADPRWPALLQHLKDAERYWQAHGPPQAKVFVPKDSPPGVPQPVLVLLHGIATSPQNVFSAMVPALWSKPTAAMAPSGTFPRGPHTFRWSEDPALDHERVQSALRQQAGELTPDTAKVVLVGFSQGGLVALDLLAAHPEAYLGAIAFSPGGETLGRFDDAKPKLDGKRVLLFVGEGEDAANLQLAERAAATFARKGATVGYRVTPGQAQHGLPLDFTGRFPGWARWAMGEGDTPEGMTPSAAKKD